MSVSRFLISVSEFLRVKRSKLSQKQEKKWVLRKQGGFQFCKAINAYAES